ncbi:MAG: hypothetical protein Q9167_007109 [Letrouitia subvulpina]
MVHETASVLLESPVVLVLEVAGVPKDPITQGLETVHVVSQVHKVELALTDNKPKSPVSSQPSHPPKHSPHTGSHAAATTRTSNPKGPTHNPGHTMITSGPVGIPTKHINPSSPAATSEGVFIGGLLFSFSKNAKNLLTDITIPATKTAILNDLEDTEDQLETLFKDMGGSLPPDTGGCGGGARRRKRGLFDLAGDIFNTVRCAINSVDSLKSHIDVPKPDIPKIEADLSDIGTLADGVDDDENKTNDDNDHTKTDDGKSTKELSTEEPSTTEPTKTTELSSSLSSTARSSSDPCLDGPATTGGIRKRADKGDTCNYKCPSPIPAAPTNGPLAITPAPTNEGDAQQKHRRDLAGRISLVKRAKGSITKINNCILTTPSSDPVNTPDYPGGFAFWQQDKNGQLPASFQAISRYYRTTDGASQQCAPTVTAVPAQQLTPNQNDQNEIISVDHAYENGWLQGFMEYIINPPNPQPHQPVLSCPAANAIFFNAYQGAQGCQVNRMAPLYNALASNDNPDFVVMSQWLNGDAKGWIMGPNFDENDGDFFDSAWEVGTAIKQWVGTNQARDSITFKLGHLKNVLLGCLIISADNVIPLMQKTNNRVYKAFQNLDTQLDTMPNGPYAGSDFSGKYRDYMENRAAVFNKAPALVSRMIDNIQNDLQAASTLPDVNANERGSLALLLASYKSTYVIGNNGAQWQYHVTFEWDSSNTRRDLKDRSALVRVRNLLSQRDGDACPIKVPPSGTLPPATGFASGTGGSGPAPTKTSGPSKTNAPPKPTSKLESCKKDSDCDDVKCSSGAAICNLPNSKHKLLRRETACIALGTCPGLDPPDDDDTTTIDAKSTEPVPTTSKVPHSPPKPSPTGVCSCKNPNATIVPSSPPKPSTTVPDKPTSTVCKEGKLGPIKTENMTLINEMTMYCTVCGGPIEAVGNFPSYDETPSWLADVLLLHLPPTSEANQTPQLLRALNTCGPYFLLPATNALVTACDNPSFENNFNLALYFPSHAACISIVKKAGTSQQLSFDETLQALWRVASSQFQEIFSTQNKIQPLTNLLNAGGLADLWHFRELEWPWGSPGTELFEADPLDVPNLTATLLNNLRPVPDPPVSPKRESSFSRNRELSPEPSYIRPANSWKGDLLSIGWLWDLDAELILAKDGLATDAEVAPKETQDSRGAWDWELLMRQLSQPEILEPGKVLVDLPLGLRNRRRVWILVEDILSGGEGDWGK